ncbi:MAG: LptF/LptG family permease [Planctomycetota bacterium]|nr:LptF/LptG family permease [Planctomycetota bacterium]
MTRLDRHILIRFLLDFAALFLMLFAFVTVIDAVLRLEDFRLVAAKTYGADEVRWWHVVSSIASFHGPRVFQFYQYLYGLVAVGAAGFTLARMQKDRELLAMLSAGISLQRVAIPILVGGLLLNVIQIVNQEVILPRLAERLSVDLVQLHRSASRGWSVPLEADATGQLIHATQFEPATGVMAGFVAYKRSAEGSITQRISAPTAKWSEKDGGWWLDASKAQDRTVQSGSASVAQTGTATKSVLFRTNLSPSLLELRRSAVSSHMMSTATLARMHATKSIGPSMYRQIIAARFGVLFVNLALLAVALPFTLRRIPDGLLKPAIQCAALTVPLGVVALGAMAVPNPWLGPALGIAVPIALLIPFSVWRINSIPT